MFKNIYIISIKYIKQKKHIKQIKYKIYKNRKSKVKTSKIKLKMPISFLHILSLV